MSVRDFIPNDGSLWSIRAYDISGNYDQGVELDPSSNFVFSINGETIATLGSNLITPSTSTTINGLDVSGTYFSNSVSAIQIPADICNNRPPIGLPGYIRYNTTINFLEYYNNVESSWIAITSPPLLLSFTPTTVTQSNVTINITGSNFLPGGSVTFIDINAISFVSPLVTYISSSNITATTPSPALSVAGQPFIVRYTGPYGLYSELSGLNTGSSPVFTNPAGTIGNIFTAGSSTSSYSLSSCAATDPDSDPITYSITTGSLPTGLTINSSGNITGTCTIVPSNNTTQTFNFTVTAATASASSTRNFSITVYGLQTIAYSYTGSNQSFVKPSGLFSMTVKLWGAGGGSGKTSGSKCGGGGGFVSGNLSMVSYSSLILVVGKGGTYGGEVSNGGSGGGYAGIFNSSVAFGNVLALAGAGGGGGGTLTTEAGFGGAGGGLTGGNGEDDTRNVISTGGKGGTQSAGGAAGADAYGAGDQLPGSTLQGGQGSGVNTSGSGGQVFPTPKIESQQYGGGGPGGRTASGVGNWAGAGGGAGYYGGGGGAQGYAGGGGGGSSYIGVLTSSTNTQGTNGSSGSASPGGTGDTDYLAGVGISTTNGSGGNAYIVLKY
jgi:hypothetical protein